MSKRELTGIASEAEELSLSPQVGSKRSLDRESDEKKELADTTDADTDTYKKQRQSSLSPPGKHPRDPESDEKGGVADTIDTTTYPNKRQHLSSLSSEEVMALVTDLLKTLPFSELMDEKLSDQTVTSSLALLNRLATIPASQLLAVLNSEDSDGNCLAAHFATLSFYKEISDLIGEIFKSFFEDSDIKFPDLVEFFSKKVRSGLFQGTSVAWWMMSANLFSGRPWADELVPRIFDKLLSDVNVSSEQLMAILEAKAESDQHPEKDISVAEWFVRMAIQKNGLSKESEIFCLILKRLSVRSQDQLLEAKSGSIVKVIVSKKTFNYIDLLWVDGTLEKNSVSRLVPRQFFTRGAGRYHEQNQQLLQCFVDSKELGGLDEKPSQSCLPRLTTILPALDAAIERCPNIRILLNDLILLQKRSDIAAYADFVLTREHKPISAGGEESSLQTLEIYYAEYTVSMTDDKLSEVFACACRLFKMSMSEKGFSELIIQMKKIIRSIVKKSNFYPGESTIREKWEDLLDSITHQIILGKLTTLELVRTYFGAEYEKFGQKSMYDFFSPARLSKPLPLPVVPETASPSHSDIELH